jgi:UDP-N-acetylglucosamine 2-epimerase (non-hydrolysing)
VLFPVHPRTRERLRELQLGDLPRVRFSEPLPYLEFLGLEARARIVLTDSGGIQEETTALGVPCLTLRTNTERPITITNGTNQLVGLDPAAILRGFHAAMTAPAAPTNRPPLWDGSAAHRVAQSIVDWQASPR